MPISRWKLSKEEVQFVEDSLKYELDDLHKGTALMILLKHKGIDNIKNLIEAHLDEPAVTEELVRITRRYPKFMKPYFPRIIENALIYQNGLDLLRKAEVLPVLKKLRKTAK